jgi:hypothetical protein
MRTRIHRFPPLPPPPPHPAMSEPSENAASSREYTPKSQLRTPQSHISPASSEQGAQDEYMPQVLKLSKSKGADALNRYFTDDEDGMYFRNTEEAVAAMNHTQWHPPTKDDTIPQDEEQDREIVRRLVEAFLDTSSAMDTEGNAYRKRLTPGTNVFYDLWTIERCAWEILVSLSGKTDGNWLTSPSVWSSPCISMASGLPFLTWTSSSALARPSSGRSKIASS